MAGRKIRDESDAHHCLRSLKASGLTLVEWARAKAVDGRSLQAWRHNLERRRRPVDPVATAAPLVEWVCDSPRLESPRCDRPGARYIVRVPGVEVEVGDDFSAETLARLLDVLGC